MTRGAVPYSCSVCGKQRDNDTNNWRLCNVGYYSFGPPSAFHCTKWGAANAAAEGTEHACGEQCALVLFSRYLATSKLTEAKSEQESGAGSKESGKAQV